MGGTRTLLKPPFWRRPGETIRPHRSVAEAHWSGSRRLGRRRSGRRRTGLPAGLVWAARWEPADLTGPIPWIRKAEWQWRVAWSPGRLSPDSVEVMPTGRTERDVRPVCNRRPVLGFPQAPGPFACSRNSGHRRGGYLASPWRPQRPAPARWDGGYVLRAPPILMNGSPLLTSEL
jgi:hypothetical protein